MEFKTVLIVLVFTIITVVIAHYMTTLIGKKSNQFFVNKEVKVLERAPIGFQSNITIIQVRGKIYILLFQNKRVETIDVIKEEDWDAYQQVQPGQGIEEQNQVPLMRFNHLLTKHLKKIIPTSNLHKKDGNDEDEK
ncbi:hypothetical protein Amet_2708 [Alkaliphilus metalliredigens QYMF]|uniref:Flagellar biosynthesis protein FliO n=1 Tax=Alkaliphilus metalliredigens (strain QYMF) TaxID=293826 RepID=A6TRP2_ALKMQ|nr:flagellar biosynthetic protein FliO [Alkaliphilus metalliredigens]ABR48860.1 hypothetical protein Amet_2708 [Alkaliphilus metalliredigens QYMF]